MIERKFVEENVKEFMIQEHISKNLRNVGHSHTKVMKTPLGEKIVIHASRPGLIVGRKGENIKKLTQTLKTKFRLENPQIEINEVEDINVDPKIVAERIASTLERFGPQRFKEIGHRTMGDAMASQALGIEILMSGKLPGSRAKRWRFYQGYLKKSGDIAITGVRTAYASARLKTGTIGIQVRIMPAGVPLPDRVEFLDEQKEETKEILDTEAKEEKKEEKQDEAK